MMEFYIKKGFKGINTKLKDLHVSKDALVVAILRGRSIIFPNGSDELKEKDTVIIASNNKKNIKDINDILE